MKKILITLVLLNLVCVLPVGANTSNCVNEGESLGAVIPGNDIQCCSGLVPYVPEGIEGTRGTCVKACVGCADINGNGVVDPTDSIYVTNRIGKCSGDTDFDAKADINGNACIGNDDVRCVIDQLGNAAKCSTCLGCADINGNGVVDPTDSIYVTNRLGKCFGDSEFEYKADLNGNGCIGADDNQCVIDQLGNTAECSTCLGCADIDGDGLVGPTDGVYVANRIGKCTGDSEYDAKADINGNGCIGADDGQCVIDQLGDIVGCNLPDLPGCIDKCGDGICVEEVCVGGGCPCAETISDCPQDCPVIGTSPVETPAINCPSGCVCSSSGVVECPTVQQSISVTIREDEAEDEAIREDEATPSGENQSRSVFIGKTSSGFTSITQGSVEAVTNENLNVVDSKVYLETSSGVKEIKTFPEEASSKATAVTSVNTIELKEESQQPIYSIKGTKQVKLLFVIPVLMQIETKVSAESGNVISVKKPWWSFLVW